MSRDGKKGSFRQARFLLNRSVRELKNRSRGFPTVRERRTQLAPIFRAQWDEIDYLEAGNLPYKRLTTELSSVESIRSSILDLPKIRRTLQGKFRAESVLLLLKNKFSL